MNKFKTKPPTDFFAQNSLQFGRRARRNGRGKLDNSSLVHYLKNSSNEFRRHRRRGSPPAKIRKGGGAAPLKTAKESGEKHRLEPYFNFGGRKFFNHF